MTDQYVQVAVGPGGVTTTDTATLTGVVAGNTIVAFLWDGSTSSTTGFGVTDGTAYTAGTTSAADGTNFVGGKCFYLQNATAGTHTIVGTTGGTAAQIMVVEVHAPTTGAHIGDASQFQATPGTGANGVSSGNITIATAVTLLALSTDSSVVASGNEPTASSGFTGRSAGTGSLGSWRLETGAASTTAPGTFTAIANHSHVTLAIAIANGSAPAGAALAGTPAVATSATGALTTGAGAAGLAGTPAVAVAAAGVLIDPPYAPILLDDPGHVGGSDQVNIGTAVNSGNGDPARTAFTKLKQWAADLNTMLAQLFGATVYAQPSTGFTLTIGSGVSVLNLDPGGTLATGTVVLPSSPGDQQIVTLASSQTITALTLSPNTGQSVNGAPTTLSGNTSVRFQYRAANTRWYRLS